MRHELRTPINHILGYCEMLMEEQQLPQQSLQDLRRVHNGGRELQSLIAHYFEEDQFYKQKDLHQLYHELRTPVNHIIGYCELLIEQAQDAGKLAPVPDLTKIRDAASNWLALVEAYLIEPSTSTGSDEELSARNLALNLGFTFKVPEPRSAQGAFKDEGTILVVDDDETSREMLARRLRRTGYVVTAVPNGLQALSLARRQKFDLVMLDMIMPGLDGFQVLAKMKADPALRQTPVIMLSALDEENGIARCIEMGAEDYLAKPFNPVFLRARIGACLEKKRLRDRERAAHEALQESQKRLAAELAQAAAYLRSLLPTPLTGVIETEWCFQPSEQLGGDAFGYHWIDENHFAMYLLDVCGHGVGAALLSVSVMNTLRARALSVVDFCQPAQVLTALNRAYRMEDHNQLYFTIWYGVYQVRERQLIYAAGGHPPALLVAPQTSQKTPIVPLTSRGPAVGCLEGVTFESASKPVWQGARLLLFSDGIFEIFKPDESVGTWDDFVQELEDPQVLALRPEERLRRAQTIRGAASLEDDFSLVEVRFR